LLDLGCGDGALLNCLVELTDFKEYHGYDFAVHLIKNLNSKVKARNFNVYEDDLNSLPEVDNIICAGMLPFVFEDEVIDKMYASLRTKKLFLRTPCTLKNEDEYVNVYSEKLKSNYSSKYRTVSNVLKTLEKHFIVESIDRIYPDNIESEFDTKQFYFCARSKS
jgi:cyclopropane fatty-acyl-phospholipid synthase-like methyltransferase